MLANLRLTGRGNGSKQNYKAPSRSSAVWKTVDTHLVERGRHFDCKIPSFFELGSICKKFYCSEINPGELLCELKRGFLRESIRRTSQGSGLAKLGLVWSPGAFKLLGSTTSTTKWVKKTPWGTAGDLPIYNT